MSPETARPAAGNSRPGLSDFRERPKIPITRKRYAGYVGNDRSSKSVGSARAWFSSYSTKSSSTTVSMTISTGASKDTPA
jgi:hypothetical protein